MKSIFRKNIAGVCSEISVENGCVTHTTINPSGGEQVNYSVPLGKCIWTKAKTEEDLTQELRMRGYSFCAV